MTEANEKDAAAAREKNIAPPRLYERPSAFAPVGIVYNMILPT